MGTDHMTYESLVEKHGSLFPSGLDAWIRELDVSNHVEPVLFTTLMWVKWCSPRGAPDSLRTIACMDLSLYFFCLDDHQQEGDALALFDLVEGILDGQAPSVQHPLSYAYRDVLDKMSMTDIPLDRHIASRKMLLDCYRRRLLLARGVEDTSFDEYRRIRATTIYIDQWLDMWEVLGRFYLEDDERAIPALTSAKENLILWHVYENDLASVDRDRQSGIPNLLDLRAAETGDSIEEARHDMERMATNAHEEFVAACNELEQRTLSDRVDQHVDLLKICHAGGLENYRRKNPGRYSRSST